MIDLLMTSDELLSDAGFITRRFRVEHREAIAFEDATVVGFLFQYGSAHDLAARWAKESEFAINENQLGLRRAGQKAWNTYLIMLAELPGSPQDTVALSNIEEDLSGTRKIARAGIETISDLRMALLALLPIQSAPKLEAVDLVSEIRLRLKGMSPRAVDAFLSKSDESVVLQVLEQQQ